MELAYKVNPSHEKMIKMMSIQFAFETVLISPKYKLVPVSYPEFKYGQFLIFQIRSNAFHTVPS